MNLVRHLERQRAFSLGAFGPGTRVVGVIDHITKELVEIEETEAAGNDTLEEWVDVILLALDGAWRSGATPYEVAQAIRDKQAINENRTWPDWRTANPEKAIEHVSA